MANQRKITITFETKEDSFREYAYLSRALAEIDEMANRFNVRKHPSERSYSKIVEVRKGSLELAAFVEQNWFAILLFAISIKGRFGHYALETFRNFEEFVALIEDSVVEVTDDFPGMELEYLKEFYTWFVSLSEDERLRVVRRLQRYGRGLRRIKRIVMDTSDGLNL